MSVGDLRAARAREIINCNRQGTAKPTEGHARPPPPDGTAPVACADNAIDFESTTINPTAANTHEELDFIWKGYLI